MICVLVSLIINHNNPYLMISQKLTIDYYILMKSLPKLFQTNSWKLCPHNFFTGNYGITPIVSTLCYNHE